MVSMDNSPLILAFAKELNTTVRIENAALRIGMTVEIIESADQIAPSDGSPPLPQSAEHLWGRSAVLLEKVTGFNPALIIFDLGNESIPWKDWISLLTSVPATRRIPVIGFGPHVVDLNNDGHNDLLSGSWPGEIFFFKGGEGRSFAAPEMIKNKDGEIINIGGGVREDRTGMGHILIAGNAKFERTSEGTFVNYHGQRFKSTPDKPYAITGTASTARAADWDGDGDHDLIIGDIRGKVYLVPNEGTPESYAFGKEEQLRAGGKPIDVTRGAGPFAADWDGDGDLDLLVGADNGSVSLYRNTGSAKSPELALAVQLVPPCAKSSRSQPPKEARRGIRAKICVADWNGDGLLGFVLLYLDRKLPAYARCHPVLKCVIIAGSTIFLGVAFLKLL